MRTNDFRDAWNGWVELPIYKVGNTSKYIKYQTFLFDVVSTTKPKNILEIGFNAGHSACCFLNASPESKMVTFDICIHGTEYVALNVLKKYYDISLIEGDSRVTVPHYLNQNPNLYFDLIFVDGGHEQNIPYDDIKNTLNRLNTGGIIIIDDMNVPDVARAVSRFDWSGYERLIPENPIEKDIRAYKLPKSKSVN